MTHQSRPGTILKCACEDCMEARRAGLMMTATDLRAIAAWVEGEDESPANESIPELVLRLRREREAA